MFIFFTFTVCALLLFVAGLQIWFSMNQSIPTQKKTGRKPILIRYQFLLTGLLLLFLLLGSCVTSYDSMMENNPVRFCPNRSNSENKTDRNTSKDTEFIAEVVPPINITKIIKKDTCVQQVAGNNKLEQSINLYSEECQPFQHIGLFPLDYSRLIFLYLIGLICLILVMLLIASFASSFSLRAKYKYKCKAKMSKYNRDVEIKKLSEKEAFYRGYYSSINSKN